MTRMLLDKPPLPHHFSSRRLQDTSPLASPDTAGLNETKLIDEVDRELTRIERLWNEYKISEDADENERMRRVQFNSGLLSQYERGLTRSASACMSRSTSEWAPKITVPKPFKMTLREAKTAQAKKNKMNSLKKETELQKERKADKELKEVHSKFKAQPVPAHVYIPLFEQQKRSCQVRDKSARSFRFRVAIYLKNKERL